MADDAFPPVTAPTIVGVSNIRYTLTDFDSGTDTMEYHATIEWSDGSQTLKQGNVVPHLTAAEVSGLQTLLARLRTKAETSWGDAPP